MFSEPGTLKAAPVHGHEGGKEERAEDAGNEAEQCATSLREEAHEQSRCYCHEGLYRAGTQRVPMRDDCVDAWHGETP